MKRVVLFFSIAYCLQLLNITFYGYSPYHPRRDLYFSASLKAIEIVLTRYSRPKGY